MSRSRQKIRRSIKVKLGLLVIASVGAAVTLLAVFTTWRDAHREAALQIQQLTATARVAASMAGEAAAARDRAHAFAVIRSLGADSDVTYARITDPRGRLLAETGRGVRLVEDVAVTAADAEFSILHMLRSQTVQVEAPIVFGRDTVGKVMLLGRLEGVGGRLVSSLLLGLVAAVVAAGLGLLVAWRMQRGIAGPLVALTRAMGEVRETHDFSKSYEVEADDEVAALVEGFNTMLAEIRFRDARIAAQVAGLEQTVAERTADLAAAKDAAEAANRAKSDFLATMSHEIRTPMNGIMVMAEMLAMGEAPPRQRRFAEVIAKSGSSLLAIINDILDFSKIEAGKMDLESAPVDPAEVAEDVASLFWEKARSKGLDLAVLVDPGVPAEVAADAVRLRQVVGNLVNNAVKFTETGGVLIALDAPAPGRLRVRVRDTGIGIPADKLATLFAAFTQADQSTTRKYGGTGLGLAICKRLVEAMGGQIDVRSQPGRGSVFGFEIPVQALREAPAPRRLAGEVALALPEGFSRLAVARHLEARGLRIVETGGDLALVEAAGAPGERSGRPVVCLAEYGDAAPPRLLREGRIDAILSQPFRRRDLDDLLAAWSEGRPLASAVDDAEAARQDGAPHFPGRRALVVDDSAVNREVALEALSRLGLEVEMACDGREAVDAVFAGRFDIVLMDGSMPEMDGYEAARLIRSREREAGRSAVPIVALTAHVVGEAAEAWRESGMDDVLHKPFSLSGLATLLARFLPPGAAVEPPVSQAEPLASAPSDLFDPEVVARFAAMEAEGRSAFVARVRDLYREHAPPAAEKVYAAAAEADPVATAKAAHALKSMSLNAGAAAVARLCAEIEAVGHAGRLAEEQVARLGEALSATLVALPATPAAAA